MLKWRCVWTGTLAAPTAAPAFPSVLPAGTPVDGPGDENVEDGDFENAGDEVVNAILSMAMLGTPILRIAAGDVNPISRIAC